MEVISEGPTRGNVFKEIARIRSEDARVLLEQNRAQGAIYLAGYSVECHLKYIVCERNEWTKLPAAIRFTASGNEIKLYTHDWAILVEVSGILPGIQRQRNMAALYYALSEQWGPKLRYATKPPRNSRALYNELAEFYSFLKETFP